MKSILVPIGGGQADKSVLDTALAAARLFSSHLQFVHMRVTPGQAAPYTPGVEFASGPALRDALSRLQTEAETRSNTAAREVQEFCQAAKIELTDLPGRTSGMTASWHEDEGEARPRLMFLSRHSDLVVMGRAVRPNGLPPDLLQALLLGCGRPVLLAPAAAPERLNGTIMVAWRETPDAARAMGAAMPLLTRAERVVFVAVEESDEGTKDAVEDVARQFSWNGVPASVELVKPAGRSVSEALFLDRENSRGRSGRHGRLRPFADARAHFRRRHANGHPPRRGRDPTAALNATTEFSLKRSISSAD